MNTKSALKLIKTPSMPNFLTALSGIALTLIVASVTAEQPAQAPHGGLKIPDITAETEIVYRKIDDIRPGQTVVGKIQIEDDREDLTKKAKKGTLDAYLLKRAVPLMRTPDGELYMLDGHHMVRSYWENGGRTVPTFIAYDYYSFDHMGDVDAMNGDTFARFAAEYGIVYLINADGSHLKDLYALPRHIKDLADDPYRALAKEVLLRKGFEKTKVSFAELYWGDYFRNEMRKEGITSIVDSSGKDIPEEIVTRAMTLAADPHKARNLPGFKTGAKND